MCHFHHGRHGIDRAERVRYVSNRNHLCARTEQPLELVEDQLALVIDWGDAQFCPLLFAEHLPWDDIGVVLHRRDEHFIIGADMSPPVGLSDEIDGFGRAAHKHNLARPLGMKK